MRQGSKMMSSFNQVARMMVILFPGPNLQGEGLGTVMFWDIMDMKYLWVIRVDLS